MRSRHAMKRRSSLTDRWRYFFLAAFAVIIASACSSGSGKTQTPMPEFTRVTPEQWQALSGATIYFGHQSVGSNIMEATRDLLRENPQIPLRIVSNKPAGTAATLNEFHIGENGDIESKNAAFVAALDGSLGPRPIVLMKYCYVDIDVGSNVDRIFKRYLDTVAAVKAKHPNATVVHVTVPLVTHSSVRDSINHLLGRPTRPMRNAQRARYNELLRAAYGGREPIYDLAGVEARRADGSEESVMLGNQRVYALAPEWAEDDGHLNAAGRRRAAEQMLATLAAVAKPLDVAANR